MLVLLIALMFFGVRCQKVNLEEHFQECQKTEETFDNCVKEGLNSLRPYFKTGLSEYNISPFDPFFASEVAQKRSGAFYNYRLILRNVTERGWTHSQILKFKTDFNGQFVQFTQFFPDKSLSGEYEFDGTFFGNKMSNRGSWNLRLMDYTQTMTVSRKPRRDVNGRVVPHPFIKVGVNIETCKKLELHIGNLAHGRTLIENMIDRIINTAWQPGFMVLKPVINDLVATAFTEIFNKNFQYFPFEKIFPH